MVEATQSSKTKFLFKIELIFVNFHPVRRGIIDFKLEGPYKSHSSIPYFADKETWDQKYYFTQVSKELGFRDSKTKTLSITPFLSLSFLYIYAV